MNIRRAQLLVMVSLVLASVMGSIWIQRNAKASRARQDESLRELRPQKAEALATVCRLATELSQLQRSTSRQSPEPKSGGADDEVERLRAEVERWRLLVQKLEATNRSGSEARATVSVPSTPVHPREYWDELHRRAGGKAVDAFRLVTAFLGCAGAHEGQAPLTVDEVLPYLDPAAPLTGTNDFELIYRGSVRSLAAIPGYAVALLRDRSTFLGPDGQQVRVYGMANGTSMLVESEDNFVSWEAEHILLP